MWSDELLPQWVSYDPSDGMGKSLQPEFFSNATVKLDDQDNWNAFGCDITEKDLIGTAQKMVDYGLRDLGYHYVILDDCWSEGRAADGTLQPNMTKFPSGMKGVADQIHDLGLGFGMYSSAGLLTCAQYPGSLGHEMIDAQTFADWGVDYLK